MFFCTTLAGGRRIIKTHYYTNITHTLLLHHSLSQCTIGATMLVLMLQPLLEPADKTFAATATLTRLPGRWKYIAN